MEHNIKLLTDYFEEVRRGDINFLFAETSAQSPLAILNNNGKFELLSIGDIMRVKAWLISEEDDEEGYADYRISAPDSGEWSDWDFTSDWGCLKDDALGIPEQHYSAEELASEFVVKVTSIILPNSSEIRVLNGKEDIEKIDFVLAREQCKQLFGSEKIPANKVLLGVEVVDYSLGNY